ncbi:transporter substrate-binding domain-containing protein [Shewanella eurypsychrophilus]|uniref:Transporter substrate-binding domain-containing protein n=1 Tax=Shewanella eurypsychrophilus TaxID=2593656 RepID=A0ABX6V5G0_9GAMM|nr:MULTISPECIES: transporter substrate-binding domain-containing protein [Shewanella]QFU22585.1 transporter substrate-binding domain-containing protein [Shewanella sp. YLB-09]QPG57874.1 transporter substrate-binding domain-containing protein [Shewanella eurypsychrophilus]
MCGNNGRYGLLTSVLIIMSLTVTQLRAETLQILTYEESPFALRVGKTHKGLLVDMLKELFSRTDLQYELKFIPLKRAIITTERMPGHCVLPVGRSQEREASFHWISPVLVSRYGLYSRDDVIIPLTTLSDAKPYTIGSFLGSGIGEYLTDLGFDVDLASVSAQNLRKLKRSRIELWAAELISAREQMQKQAINFGAPELIFYTSLRAMACNREMSLETTLKLEQALTSMYLDGYMSELYLEYGVEI